MKKYIIVILISLAYFNLYAQKSYLSKNVSIHDTCLVLYIDKYISFFNKKDKIFIENDDYCKINLSNIGNINIISLRHVDVIKSKDVKELIRVTPIKFLDTGFYVSIIEFKIKRKRNRCEYINQGGCNFHIQLECSSNKLLITPLAPP